MKLPSSFDEYELALDCAIDPLLLPPGLGSILYDWGAICWLNIFWYGPLMTVKYIN